MRSFSILFYQITNQLAAFKKRNSATFLELNLEILRSHLTQIYFDMALQFIIKFMFSEED